MYCRSCGRIIFHIMFLVIPQNVSGWQDSRALTLLAFSNEEILFSTPVASSAVPTSQTLRARTFSAPPLFNEILNDIFISVKTTKNYHESRLRAILKTWFQIAKKQVMIFLNYLFIIYSIGSFEKYM